jgi:hypothetical protein
MVHRASAEARVVFLRFLQNDGSWERQTSKSAACPSLAPSRTLAPER